ncbi:MAG: hypothetical protein ACO25B_12025, partial [Chitinophagaceae bacterium]
MKTTIPFKPFLFGIVLFLACSLDNVASAQRRDRIEGRFDRHEDVRDRREDIRDRREDRRDACHQGGLLDRIEDMRDR